MTALPTTPAPALDDQRAVRRYAAVGDPRAFEVLVRRYQGMVLATCLRVMRSEADAQDAVQETFFKLARSAGQIRSNIGAWLHACALGTARDLLRSRGSRLRAEQQRAQHQEPMTPDASWTDVQALLDEAIAKLHEDDRELIIARFLVGRAQADMAKDAGLSPGAMSRRIDKALERLRGHLSASGCVIVGAAVVATLDRAAHAAVVSPQLSGSLMKVGLAGTALRAPAAAGVSALSKALVLAAALALAGGGALWLANRAGTIGATSGTTTAVLGTGGGTSRPIAPTDPLANISYDVAGGPIMTIESDGRTVRVEHMGKVLHKPDVLTVKIISADEAVTPIALDLEVVGVKSNDENVTAANAGQKLKATALINGRDLRMTIMPDSDSPHHHESEEWLGREYSTPQLAPIKPASDAVASRFVGRWAQVQPASLVLSPDDLTIKTERFTDRRFHILEWTDGPEYAKVQTICADSRDASWVGKRVKVLVRRDADGYTLAFHDVGSRKVNEWPSGFDATKDEALHVSTWRKAAP